MDTASKPPPRLPRSDCTVNQLERPPCGSSFWIAARGGLGYGGAAFVGTLLPPGGTAARIPRLPDGLRPEVNDIPPIVTALSITCGPPRGAPSSSGRPPATSAG